MDSVLQQTLADWELILIDDGSSDGCGEILDRYQRTDSRIKPIHIENAGVSNARNLGLSHACGKYVCFLDGDDWWAPDYLRIMTQEIIKQNADMIQCGYQKVYESGANTQHIADECKEIHGRDAILLRYFDLTISPNVWAKIFLTDRIKEIAFNTDFSFGEDALFTFEFCCCAHSIGILNESLYFYYQRDNSATHQNLSEQNFQFLRRFDLFYKNLESTEPAYSVCAKVDIGKCMWLLRKINSEGVCLEKRSVLRDRIINTKSKICDYTDYKTKTRFVIWLLQYFPHITYALMSVIGLPQD